MNDIIVIGGCLVGSLLSICLARRGCAARIYDRKPNPRSTEQRSSRSINLTLCERGFAALARVGACGAVRAVTVPARELFSVARLPRLGEHNQQAHRGECAVGTEDPFSRGVLRSQHHVLENPYGEWRDSLHVGSLLTYFHRELSPIDARLAAGG
jgi:2-polyprenyl-6-methoxyphenol hydroxylase-like FAD-dependent oxidoreductase